MKIFKNVIKNFLKFYQIGQNFYHYFFLNFLEFFSFFETHSKASLFLAKTNVLGQPRKTVHRTSKSPGISFVWKNDRKLRNRQVHCFYNKLHFFSCIKKSNKHYFCWEKSFWIKIFPEKRYFKNCQHNSRI